MTPNKEKESTKHLKTLDKDQLIELLLQFKCDAELLQGVANDVCDAMNEKLVLEKALELACDEIDGNQGSLSQVAFDYFIEQARESLKNDN